MKAIFLGLVALLSTLQIANADISGLGYGNSEKEAKSEALADLATNIKAEVRFHIESTSNDDGTKTKSHTKVSANLPLLGVYFYPMKNPTEIQIRAILSSKDVSKMYSQKLKNISKEIKSLENELKKTSNPLEIYEDIYSLLLEYDRYESVAFVLDMKLPSRLSMNKAEVKVAISKINANINTLNVASRVLAKHFSEKDIFVYAPQLKNYTSISQFASVFAKELKGKLRTASTPKSASYILVGSYELMKSSMVLNYQLLDVRTHKVVKSKTINIKKSAYKNLAVKPKNIDFDALLNSGVISSSNLKVSLTSNRGNENLLFESGEEIELFIKLNKMSYVYIVGYTQTTKDKFSYLLELNEGHGDAKFKMFVNADDANRWMSLGAFTVEEPFGVESLQIIASNKKITTLPSTSYDEESGYYVIGKDIKKTLSQTRGLKRKKSKRVEISEDVLSFTTVK